MSQFNVYESSGGTITAARSGWSWGGFLFGWIWALVNGLWLYALGHFVFMFVYFQIYSAIYNQGSVLLLSIFGLSVPVVYGIFGNQWLGAKVSSGGTKIDTVDASSNEGAVMLYMQKKQFNSIQSRNF
jgi:hypothetical protein